MKKILVPCDFLKPAVNAFRFKGDLIAMGTHGRKGVAHLVIGSIAEDVVNHNKGLVWTYSLQHESAEA